MVYCPVVGKNVCQECKFCTFAVTFPVLTNELIPNEVVIQNYKADHGELRQIDLKLKALVKDGVVPVLGHRPSAALCAVDWNSVYFHIHVGVHYIPLGTRTPWLWQVLTAYYLGLDEYNAFTLLLENNQ